MHLASIRPILSEALPGSLHFASFSEVAIVDDLLPASIVSGRSPKSSPLAAEDDDVWRYHSDSSLASLSQSVSTSLKNLARAFPVFGNDVAA